jgi:membrane AbrB-like protein
MGAAVTPEAFANAGEWPLAILALVVVIAALTAASYVPLRRIGGFDPPSALCASSPGALSHVLATAIEAGISVPRVALAQALRLVVLVAVLPPLIAWLGGARGLGEAGLPPVADLPESVLMVVPCGVAGFVASRLRVPAGMLLGAFVTSSALHAFGVFETRLPDVVLDPAFVLLGTTIGAAFAGTTRSMLLSALGGSAVALVAVLAVSLATAWAFSAAFGAPFGEIVLAFAPGGIEAMVTLAFLLGYDVPFVAAMHLIRILILILGLPIALRLIGVVPKRVAHAPDRGPS